jgi:hypothetical protein
MLCLICGSRRLLELYLPLTLKPLNLAGCLGEFTVDTRETQYHVLSNINDKVH